MPIPDDHTGAVLEGFAERARLHQVALERADGAGRTDFALRARPTPKAVDGAGEREFAALRPAYLRFTSGTTSRRKGVILGHAAILARLDAANRGLGIGPADRILWLLPMAHHFVVSILLYLRARRGDPAARGLARRGRSSSSPRASARPCSTPRRTT